MDLARLDLNHLIGLPLETDVRPSVVVVAEPVMARVEELTTHALSNRPDLNAMAREIEALRADVRASQAAWFPQVSFVGNYRYARPNPYIFPQEDAFTGTWDVGVSLSMNLWAGGRTRAEARQAKAQAAQQWEDARTSVEVAVRRQVPAIQHAEVALQVSQEGLEEAEEAFRVMRARFRQGGALTAEVLAAEAAYRRAEQQRAEAQADYAVAHAALQRVLGEISLE